MEKLLLTRLNPCTRLLVSRTLCILVRENVDVGTSEVYCYYTPQIYIQIKNWGRLLVIKSFYLVNLSTN